MRTVATTILNQIGRLNLYAWGYKQGLYDDNSVTFSISTPKYKRNVKVKVELNNNDLYDIYLMKIDMKKVEVKTIAELKDVFNTNLSEVIESLIEN